jgi:tRNA(Ile2) C34 agmatinyltransferase TiaS
MFVPRCPLCKAKMKMHGFTPFVRYYKCDKCK